MARKKTTATRLVLDGALTIRTAETTYTKLLEVAERPVVELDCGGATEVDLSFVQLVLAARASARRRQQVLRLAQPPEGPLYETLQRGGFLAASIDGATADQAFWLQPTRT